MDSTSKIQSQELDRLFKAILGMESIDECYRFFEDICTISELQAIAQRLEVARLLRKKVTYQQISKQTGASTATISRVNRCVVYGTGGYDIVLDRMPELFEE
ncbi:MAG: TrpR-like protein YerC/YecD [Clostridiales bacterium]|nr:TrpR-like protein YerC/YecD [Clostridiales bacterium]